MLTLQLYFAQRLVVRHSAVIAMRYMDKTEDLRHLGVAVFYVVRQVNGCPGFGGRMLEIPPIHVVRLPTVRNGVRPHNEHFILRAVSPILVDILSLVRKASTSWMASS